MGTLAPMAGPKRFESADRLLQFCASNRIPMRGHCLIWNEWVPQWIKSMSNSERQAFFDAGAVACLSKDGDLEQIVAAIEKAAWS
jgi:endo-1,4-beta-xylanase